MSFELDLEIPNLDWQLATRLVEATQTPDSLRVLVSASRPRWLRRGQPRASLEDARADVPVLSDDATWSQSAFSLDGRGRELLARTIEIIGEIAPPGWSLRAAWIDDPLKHEADVTAHQLAELARSSKLDRITRYYVRPKRSSAAT